MSPRLLIVASHPIQYFVPIYRQLARRGNVDVRVVYCRDYGVRPTFDKQFGGEVHWDVDLLGGYEHAFLPNLSPIHDTFNPLHAVNPTVVAGVLRWADAIWINGLVYPTNWFALLAAKLARVPVMIRSELHPFMLRGESVRARAKRTFYRGALRLVDRALTIGAPNRDAYAMLGFPRDRMSDAKYVVDMSRFAVSDDERLARRAARRAEWGVGDDDVAVLFLGKFTRRKHPEALLALDGASAADRLALVWVGAGEMESILRDGSARLAQARPVLPGMANQSEIPDVLWAADIFAFPSEGEPWGLVLNEAMAAGLPSVVCDEVGASRDLCVDGETGFVFSSGDENAFVAAVDRLATDSALRARAGLAARDRISDWTPELVAASIEEAVLTSVGTERR